MSPTSNDAHRDDRPSPSRSAVDSLDLHQSRPPPRSVNRSFDLEPNPFEQSFSSTTTADRKPDDKSQNSPDDAPSKSKQDNDQKPVLPSLAALSSPSDGYSWTDLASSLRSGPLSPAMLQGPQQPQQQQSSSLSLNPYDHTRPFGRTGLTPSTGLTPLVGGSVSFPPPSPNTAAFLAMVTNSSTAPPQLNPTPATITPNTLSAITGMLNPTQASQSSGTIAPSATSSGSATVTIPAPVSQQQQQLGYPYASNANNYASNSTAATTAANGLFLLSQAHQELAKREEAQARADANASVKRTTKRKSIDGAPAPTAGTRSQAKRPRANSSRGGKKAKGSTGSQDDDDSGDDDDDHRLSPELENTQLNGTTKKPETEDEKRKNFLERNRQAALKCRQRKKAWLASLQAQNEYLKSDNERLNNALVASREEISRLNALLAGPPQPGMSVSAQPISVAVSLPSAGKGVQAQAQGPPVSVVNGRGYGY